MDMKKLLNIVGGNIENKQLNEGVDECGGMSTPSPAGNVSMNVSLNAQGVDNIKQLLDLMKSADAPTRMSPPMAMPAPGMDMPISITKIKPSGMDRGDADGMAQIRNLISKADKPEEAYANEPDEEYADLSASIPSGDDLHKEKGAYPKANDGDNAMALETSIRSNLDKLYREIKEGNVAETMYYDPKLMKDIEDTAFRQSREKSQAADNAELANRSRETADRDLRARLAKIGMLSKFKPGMSDQEVKSLELAKQQADAAQAERERKLRGR